MLSVLGDVPVTGYVTFWSAECGI